MGTSREIYSILSKYSKKKKIKFSITPFYLEAVDRYNKYVDFLKLDLMKF